MSTNNFKAMEEEARKKVPEAPQHIQRNVDSNIHSLSFIGKVVELFTQRIYESLISMVGGESNKNRQVDSPTTKENNATSSRGNAKSDETSGRGEIF